MHRLHLHGTIGQDNEAQGSVKKPVKILILWSGAVVPAYREFFLELARHMQVRVLSPRRWMHGSKDFSGTDAEAAGAEAADAGSGKPAAGEPETGSGCEFVPVAYLPERSSRYWVPALAFHLWAFRPRYLYIMDEMDRPSLAWHALSARLAWPSVRIVNYALQNIPAPGYYRRHHRLAHEWACHRLWSRWKGRPTGSPGQHPREPRRHDHRQLRVMTEPAS